MGKHGFSFSWKRATGLSAMKSKISRATGVPLTKSGRQRKLGKAAGCLLPLFCLVCLIACAITVSAQSVREGKAITNWTPIGWAADASKRADGAKQEARIEGDGRMEMSFANVQRSGDTFKGWMRFVFPSSVLVLEGNWNEIRFYVVCDCRKDNIKALTGIAYGSNGAIRAEESKQILEHTVPGSMGRQLFEFFCERGGPTSMTPPKLKPKS